MPAEPIPFTRRKASAPAPVGEVHILWITAGLSCDGDSVSVTNAEQPSIEDVILGAIPGLPKVHLHNPVLAYEVGDDFMKYFHQADRSRLYRVLHVPQVASAGCYTLGRLSVPNIAFGQRTQRSHVRYLGSCDSSL
jgi:Ni,Fe-hydrogenase I small subunit